MKCAEMLILIDNRIFELTIDHLTALDRQFWYYLSIMLNNRLLFFFIWLESL